MQTIIVEEDNAIRDILQLNLEAFAGTDVISRLSSEEVIKVLTILPSVDLIVMRAKVGSDEVAKNIRDFLDQENLDIPCIIIGDVDPEKYPGHRIIPIYEDWEDVVTAAFQLLGISSEAIERKVKPKFIPIDIRFFFEITEPPCDVYVRIRQNNQDYEYQFVKLIHSKDEFDHSLIEKYEHQGLTDFYIEQDYHQYFVTAVTNNLMKRLTTDNISLDQKIIHNDNAYRIIMDKVDNMGLDDESIELAHACIKSMKNSIKESEKLSDMLDRLFSNRISYAYQKAHLTFIIATAILRQIEGHSKEDINTISYACFFADITLKSQKQLGILNYQNFLTSDLDLAQKSIVEFHARKISKVLEESGLFSDFVIQVVKEHHGSKNGVGFPKNFPRTLHYLSYLFIVADYFVSTLLHPRKPSTKSKIIEIISTELNSKQFKPYLEALKGKLY